MNIIFWWAVCRKAGQQLKISKLVFICCWELLVIGWWKPHVHWWLRTSCKQHQTNLSLLANEFAVYFKREVWELSFDMVDTQLHWQIWSHIYVFCAKYAQQQTERRASRVEPKSVRFANYCVSVCVQCFRWQLVTVEHCIEMNLNLMIFFCRQPAAFQFGRFFSLFY